jgi:hypothetical protein
MSKPDGPVAHHGDPAPRADAADAADATRVPRDRGRLDQHRAQVRIRRA